MPYRTLTSDAVTIHIAASPERVYDLIADITQMGRWSPECHRCEWVERDCRTPQPGARFKAHNKRGILRWSNTPTVIVADRGREFAFTRTAFGAGEYVWRYCIREDANG